VFNLDEGDKINLTTKH